MVPTMLTSSISVLSQSIVVILGMILILQLEANGSLSQMASAVSTGNYTLLAQLFFSSSVLDSFIVFAVSSFAIAIVVTILATGFVLSAEYGSYLRAIGGERMGVAEVMSMLRSRWRAMSWTYFLSSLIVYLPIILAVLGSSYAVYSFRGNPLAAVFLFYPIGGAALVTVLLAFFLMYSSVAVAAENVSGFTAIRRSFRRASDYFSVSLVYAIVRLVSLLAISLVALYTTDFGLPLSSLASIAISLLLTPVLHMTKTAIYREMTLPAEMEFEVYGDRSAGAELFRGPYIRYGLSKIKQGLRELLNFVFDLSNIVYHLLSILAFLFGVYAGAYVATHGLTNAIFALGYKPGQINPTKLSSIPLSQGFDIFLHNWQVSLSTALSGIWLVAPSLITLGFNGVILGAVYYLTPNSTMFAAAILPHGFIEIPSFIIAGSAGVKLGVTFFRAYLWKGSSKSDSVAVAEFKKTARQVIYVVIGLAVLFLIAGTIEGNITPIIMRSVGWH